MSDIPDSVEKIKKAGYTLEELFERKEILFTPEELEQVDKDCINSHNEIEMLQYGLAVMLVMKQKAKYDQAMRNRIK